MLSFFPGPLCPIFLSNIGTADSLFDILFAGSRYFPERLLTDRIFGLKRTFGLAKFTTDDVIKKNKVNLGFGQRLLGWGAHVG